MATMEIMRRYIREALEGIVKNLVDHNPVAEKRFDLVASSIVDTLCRVEWNGPGDAQSMIGRMISLIQRHLDKSCLYGSSSNKDLQGCLHEFREKLCNDGFCLKRTRSETHADMILKITGGLRKNKNQVYRSQTLAFVLENMKLVFPANERYLIFQNILPINVIGNPDNSDWSRIQGTWIIRMFYYKCTERLAIIDRCAMIWEVFNMWEKFYKIPPQLASLGFDQLNKFLPAVSVMFTTETCDFKEQCDRWRVEIDPYVDDSFHNFAIGSPLFSSRGSYNIRSVLGIYQESSQYESDKDLRKREVQFQQQQQLLQQSGVGMMNKNALPTTTLADPMGTYGMPYASMPSMQNLLTGFPHLPTMPMQYGAETPWSLGMQRMGS